MTAIPELKVSGEIKYQINGIDSETLMEALR